MTARVVGASRPGTRRASGPAAGISWTRTRRSPARPLLPGIGPTFECADVEDSAYPDGAIADKAIADLRRLKTMDKPFFLAAGFHKPHLPFNAPKKYWDLYERDKITPANNAYGRRMRRTPRFTIGAR